MNKYNVFGLLAVLGVVSTIFAAWAKITHQAYAEPAMTIGLFLSAIAIASLVWFLFMWLKKKENS
jgi:hypothetical protein